MTEILDEILNAMTAPRTLLSWDRLVFCELVEDEITEQRSIGVTAHVQSGVS